MSDTIIIKTAMNEAYWQAARAMCSYCGKGNIPTKNPYTAGWWEHKIQHLKYTPDCSAGPIHALIEKLNEVQE